MEMKYVKTFENFNLSDVELNSINEGLIEDCKKLIVAKVKTFKKEQLDSLNAKIVLFAEKLGISTDDLKDSKKVEAAIRAKNLVKESEEFDINEGKLGKIQDWLVTLGLGGIGTSLVLIAIGAIGGSVAASIAIVVSVLAVIIGAGMMSVEQAKEHDKKYGDKATVGPSSL